ncbi:hypothetical protein XENTR_v10004219 [Xenopus tropicalis]|nr:hypothetical protein XENTR_v10004219 [Xenopus tropicalis]
MLLLLLLLLLSPCRSTIYYTKTMKRREPPLTSSGVRRRARIALEKRLHDIADLQPEPTFTTAYEADAYSTTNDSDSRLSRTDEHLDSICTDDFGGLTERQCVSEPDSESEPEVADEPVSFVETLANWSVQFGVSLVALSALLSLLRVYHPELPKDARTILKTKTEYKIQQKCGGFYHYRGILTALWNTLTKLIEKFPNGFTFKLQVNIDGLPLFKSTNLQLWPILGLLLNAPMKEPVVIGLFCGTKKPNAPDEYLKDFTHELKQLQEGVYFKEKKVFFELDSVVCDTPARAFVKNVKAHNGYHGCDKCCQPGVYVNHRMTYPQNDFVLRTDSSFSDKVDEDHHHDGPHGFFGLDVGMVTRFPIDYMHLACLGVTRKLLNVWLRGPLKFRLSSGCVDRISQTLTQMRAYIPVEFVRKPRSLRELDRWKATELRQFLLYTGSVALAPYLDHNLYNNFMLFYTGICILVSPQLYSLFNNYANTLLTAFVKHVGELYGKDALVYNVHALVHLSADAKLHGSLDTISAFPYENYLRTLKKFVRKPEFPLAQIIRRLSEVEKISSSELPCKALRMQHYVGPVPDGLQATAQYRELRTEHWSVKASTGDNVFAIGKDICVILNIVQSVKEIYVVFRVFTQIANFFNYPMSSDFLRVFIVSEPTGPLRVAKASQISHKCVLLPYKDKFVVMPLLHTRL